MTEEELNKGASQGSVPAAVYAPLPGRPDRQHSAGLSDLLARVEAASGPDPALGGRIFAALFGGVASQDCTDPTRRSYSEQAWFTNAEAPTVLIADTHHAAHVTASLDAALALVERVLPGVWWFTAKGRLCASEPLYGARLLFGADEEIGAAEHEHGAALALLAALLRALGAQNAAG